jgi:hypothetical protein
LVTNRHNIDYSYKKGERTEYVIKTLECLAWGAKIGENDKIYREILSFYASKMRFGFPENFDEDVCVYAMGDVESQLTKEGSHWRPFAFDLEFLATDEDYLDSNPGEPLLMYGYSKLENAEMGSPIARHGVFCSEPSHNYRQSQETSARRIAVEAMSTSGMSGSPIVAFSRGGGGSGSVGLTLPNARRDYLVGINAAHYHDDDDRNPSLNSSVSRCFKATIVRELIDKEK